MKQSDIDRAQTIKKATIINATKPKHADVLNDVLYQMVKQYPEHKKASEIYAKVCIIGRAYSASLERGAGHDPDDGKFYWDKIIPALKAAKLDKLLDQVRKFKSVSTQNLPVLLNVHKRLVDAIGEVTGKDNRSFVSKYLHFHFKELFFIYDSLAQSSIRKYDIPKSLRPQPSTSAPESDGIYEAFCWKCLDLRDAIKDGYDIDLTPRQLDNLLLGK
ncbi:MAG: hypothetical protein Q8Q81_00005 [Oxalobacteraceae bacterium]|nr:hypothetical protein [Oxalobacteraceae bacterium]